MKGKRIAKWARQRARVKTEIEKAYNRGDFTQVSFLKYCFRELLNRKG